MDALERTNPISVGEWKAGQQVYNPFLRYLKYMGSKRSLIPVILSIIPKNVKTIVDGFSGSGIVAHSMALNGYNIHANDIMPYSQVLNTAMLRSTGDFSEIIESLNYLQGTTGWFTETYGNLNKLPFSIENLNLLDRIRAEIDNYDGITKTVLLASLILALDRVDSTMGHFTSYLRSPSKRSQNRLHLNDIPVTVTGDHTITCSDIFDILPANADLSYYDPPYGSDNNKMPSSRVRYAQYYHFWNTVVLNDKPVVKGVSARRLDDRIPNPFEDFRRNEDGIYRVQNTLSRLMRETTTKYVIFSYNNHGRLTYDALMDVFRENYKVIKFIELSHRGNVMITNSGKGWERDFSNNTEWLFLLKNARL